MQEEKKGKYSLTEGNILERLLLVALPVMGTQIVTMTYNMTDMYWLGRVGSSAVAASGTAGMFMWFSNAFMMFGRLGAEIGVSQRLGADDKESALKYGQASVLIGILIGVLYALFLVIFKEPLVGFFNIREAAVIEATHGYLTVIAIGLPFTFISSAVAGIFNGSGNSRITFFVNGTGLIINMILDPIMIFNLNMGIVGAAWATVAAQVFVAAVSVLAVKFYRERPFSKFGIIRPAQAQVVRQIFAWASPASLESFMFTFLSMFISRFVAEWGAGAMATQRISGQIESLSWLMANGFSSALTAFIGQNFGAGKWMRIHKGFDISSIVMALWGGIVTVILFFGGGAIFAVFLPGEPAVIAMGRDYMKILAFCQIIGCLEAIAAGAFRGLGKTYPPTVVSATCNFLRVIAAYYLTKTSLGLYGIFWAVAVGMAARGIWMFAWYRLYARSLPGEDV